MNYTENYQLPQWVETDRIMMEDFNEAMAKVDEGCGNCRIVYGSYVGTGLASMDHPNMLTFTQTPKFVAIANNDTHLFLVQGVAYAYVYKQENTYRNQVNWTDTGVSWNVPNNYQDAYAQMDTEGSTYFYIALL